MESLTSYHDNWEHIPFSAAFSLTFLIALIETSYQASTPFSPRNSRCQRKWIEEIGMRPNLSHVANLQ